MTEQTKVTPITKSETNKSGYGWIPDLPDHRDIMYSAVRKIPVKLPTSVDLRPTCSKVEDQGQLGSCTGNVLVGALGCQQDEPAGPLRVHDQDAGTGTEAVRDRADGCERASRHARRCTEGQSARRPSGSRFVRPRHDAQCHARPASPALRPLTPPPAVV